MREMLRDKRVLISTIVGPIFLIFLMLVLFGYLQNSLMKPKVQKVHVLMGRGANPVLDSLKSNPMLQIVKIKSAEEGRNLIQEGTAKLVLLFPDDIDKTLSRGEVVTVTAVRDIEEPMASIPLALVQKTIKDSNSARLGLILQEQHISPDLAESIRLDEAPIRTSEGLGGAMILSFIPYMVVIWAFYGGVGIVTDMVTGEKEKSTLETLLISPVSRSQIAMGKFLALCCACIAGSLTSLLCVLGVGISGMEITKSLFPNGVTISLMTVLALVATIVPLVAMFSGLLISISAFARNIREAQTYLTLVSFIVLMPAIFSQIIGYTDYAKAKWIFFVPVLNSATCIKDALINRVDGQSLLITSGVSLILAALTINQAIRLFNREQILTRI
jgi:sodium transport system permease protein